MASNYVGEEDDYELVEDDDKDDDEDLARLDDDLAVDEEDDDVDVDERTDRVVGTTRWRGRKKLKLGVEEARGRGRGRRVGGGGRSSLGAASTTTTSGLAATTAVSASQTTTAARPTDQVQVEAKRQLAVKIDRVCEYALVLMHCILYKINYYNRKTHFDKSIKYDIVVYKCKSEIVCEYINNCVECMRLLLYDKYHLDSDTTTTTTTRLDFRSKKDDNDTFSIGLAVLKSEEEGEDADILAVNMLIKRYTLQIECLLLDTSGNEKTTSSVDEWNFRDSLLKCLYSKDIQYPKNFKWQIQIRTHKSSIQKMNTKEDLFKLFAWRQCEREEITSIKSKSSSYNRLSIKPIKTMNHLGKLRIQLFIEQSIQNVKR